MNTSFEYLALILFNKQIVFNESTVITSLQGVHGLSQF